MGATAVPGTAQFRDHMSALLGEAAPPPATASSQPDIGGITFCAEVSCIACAFCFSLKAGEPQCDEPQQAETLHGPSQVDDRGYPFFGPVQL